MAKQHMLIVTEGLDVGHMYVLHDAVSMLGRASDNTITIDSPRVSRRHAQIRISPGGAIIEDMDSTNGTWVNDRQVRLPTALTSGDLIGLADVVTFQYVVEEVQPVAQPFTRADRPTASLDDVPRSAEPDPFGAASAPVPYREIYPSDALVEPPAETDRGARRRSPLVYVVVVLLILLICICVALAVYLWFAPLEFWEELFRIIGLPMP